MKSKLVFLLSCLFLIFASIDEDNIIVAPERLENENIKISWLINYEEYDTIILEVEHMESSETFQLPSKSGNIELC